MVYPSLKCMFQLEAKWVVGTITIIIITLDMAIGALPSPPTN
jgi:hypothetical protein